MVHFASVLCIALFISAGAATYPSRPYSSPSPAPPIGLQANMVPDEGFVFDLAGAPPSLDTAGGKSFTASLVSFPALNLPNGGGLQSLFKFEPCGFRTAHVHPRGTENFFVVKGKIRANLLREAGGALGQEAIANEIEAGFSGFFPAGQIHFLQNIGCEEAITIAMFDTPDPGTSDIAASLRLPIDIIQQTFGNKDLIADDAIIDDVLMQSKKCLARCARLGMKKKSRKFSKFAKKTSFGY